MNVQRFFKGLLTHRRAAATEFRLGGMESEAIAPTVEVTASWALLDERKARAAAQRMNLKITVRRLILIGFGPKALRAAQASMSVPSGRRGILAV